MKVRKRTILNFFIALAVLSMFGDLAYRQLDGINKRSAKLASEGLPGVKAILKTRASLEKLLADSGLNFSDKSAEDVASDVEFQALMAGIEFSAAPVDQEEIAQIEADFAELQTLVGEPVRLAGQLGALRNARASRTELAAAVEALRAAEAARNKKVADLRAKLDEFEQQLAGGEVERLASAVRMNAGLHPTLVMWTMIVGVAIAGMIAWKGLARFEEWTLLVTVLVALCMLFIGVFTRYFLTYTMTWPEELVRHVILYTTFIGTVVGIKNRALIRIDALPSLVPKLKKPLDYLTNVAMLCLAGFLMWYGYKEAVIKATEVQLVHTVAIKIPVFYLRMVLPIMGLTMAVRVFEVVYEDITGKPFDGDDAAA